MAPSTIAAHEAAQSEARGSAPVTGTDGPAFAILRQYWPQLRHLLPSHIKPEAWYAAVYAALYKGTYRGPKESQLDLITCANKNPESLMFALFDAARLGLEPGTEQYYLTPRPNKNARNGVEVLGMRGYQGEIELIYRAGAVSSVVADVVREKDTYRYQRGVDRTPVHQFDPWASYEERGKLVGVYAYCVMKDGAISRVVELNLDDIARAKRSSPTARYDHSPWNTDEAAMFLKTGIHRIQKFVPTSAEYITIQFGARATAIAQAEHRAVDNGTDRAMSPLTQAALAAPTGQPGATTPPEPPLDITRFTQPPAPEDIEPESVDAQPETPLITPQQSKRMHTIFTKGAINRETALAYLSIKTGREITTSNEVTEDEARKIIFELARMESGDVPLVELIMEIIDRPETAHE